MNHVPLAPHFGAFFRRLSLWLLIGLCLLQLPVIMYLYTQWQISQQEHKLLGQRLEQNKYQQASELSRIGQRFGQLQAELAQVNVLGRRLIKDYDLADELPLKRQDVNLLHRPINGFADLYQTLAQALAKTQEYGIHLAALETLLLNLHINETTQVQGHPVLGFSRVSSGFGTRTDPFTGQVRWHKGQDFAGQRGQPISATATGVVSVSKYHPDFGNMVEINHGQGWVTRYAHLDSLWVNVGERVEKGQKIAQMGRTGRATGVHLHYEVLKGNRQQNPKHFLPH
ncbi:M23 family metallopeptidase [Oceanisphaera pacifica]|uniref:M23 family metallopeptidase n=1 Tax=Oceanisphaera pacifica TaxID=2818389 RepID=A0ABS3NG00_9GAMM|nr:M23 family metallopeptidase [Oceanisphaera pacifica]MBO1519303.1 M23 family metallopeptidase [Oceanisphaera pacifica]